ncbi:uncharacterized protein [Antedon mediterranea]|uniref:uncharacterized protein n=1 Tax=Antedon mediterranea TaxID=105859 RepID=UPI003AF4403F
MATGHILPGFSDLRGGGIVSQFRSRSADPIMTGYRHRVIEYSPTSTQELEAIRRAAVKAWTPEPTDKPTTYSNSYYNKGQVSKRSLTKARPTSTTRRNKPHPPNVFLTCHLKEVPGYHDPDSAFGKELNAVEGFRNPDDRVKTEIYRIDGVCRKEEQEQRKHLREKYIGRPATAGVLPYDEKSVKEMFQDPRQAQAAEAWMKLARRKDRQAIHKMMDTTQSKAYCMESNKKYVKVPYQSSVHRYLKAAGARESKVATRLFQSLESDPNRYRTPLNAAHYHITDYSSQVKDAESTKPRIRPWKYDFTIHPEFHSS